VNQDLEFVYIYTMTFMRILRSCYFKASAFQMINSDQMIEICCYFITGMSQSLRAWSKTFHIDFVLNRFCSRNGKEIPWLSISSNPVSYHL